MEVMLRGRWRGRGGVDGVGERAVVRLAVWGRDLHSNGVVVRWHGILRS